MPVLYYRDPSSGDWKPFATTDVTVLNEVQIGGTPPEIRPEPEGIEIWIDPAEDATGGDGWDIMDDRFVNQDGDVMTGDLTLAGPPTDPSHAANKDYVDNYVNSKVDIINQTIAGLDPFHVGMIMPFAGDVLPKNWLLCNGAAIPQQYTQLRAMIGAVTPDLQGRFLMGSQAGVFPIRQPGGPANGNVALSIANMPSHNHGGVTHSQNANHQHHVQGQSLNTGTQSANHGHWIGHVPRTAGGGGHDHQVQIEEGLYKADVDGVWVDTVQAKQGEFKNVWARTAPGGGGHSHSYDAGSMGTGHNDTNHHHGIHVNAHWTDVEPHVHGHGINPEGGGAAFSIRPPYWTINYIIYAGK